jgi:hypothetical protein
MNRIGVCSEVSYQSVSGLVVCRDLQVLLLPYLTINHSPTLPFHISDGPQFINLKVTVNDINSSTNLIKTKKLFHGATVLQ